MSCAVRCEEGVVWRSRARGLRQLRVGPRMTGTRRRAVPLQPTTKPLNQVHHHIKMHETKRQVAAKQSVIGKYNRDITWHSLTNKEVLYTGFMLE